MALRSALDSQIGNGAVERHQAETVDPNEDHVRLRGGLGERTVDDRRGAAADAGERRDRRFVYPAGGEHCGDVVARRGFGSVEPAMGEAAYAAVGMIRRIGREGALGRPHPKHAARGHRARSSRLVRRGRCGAERFRVDVARREPDGDRCCLETERDFEAMRELDELPDP